MTNAVAGAPQASGPAGGRASQGRVWAHHEWKMLVGGRLAAARSGAVYATTSPSTEEVIAQVPDAGPADVADAVTAGQAAQRTWGRSDHRERAALLRTLSRILRENSAELAMLDAFDGGNPVTAMRADVDLAAELVDYFSELGSHLGGQTVPAPGTLSYTTRSPYGVVARIVPYNHPLMFTASRLAAPLMAGNAVVVKAPDQAPLSALRLGELLAEHVPPGLVSILSGTGPGAGRAIVEHPDVRRIGFIGSVAVGRDIQRHAAQAAVKAVTLELGGKNAMIVRADAEPSAAADGAIRGMNFRWTAGQSCGSTSRLLVHRSIHDEVVDRIADRVQDIRVGDPLLPETEMGPVISAAHRDRVLAHVDRAVAGGARLVTGGPTAASGAFRRGYWVLPTVLAAVEPGSEVEQREIFGPVLSVLAYDDDATAVRIANGTEYGLTASVWTRDIDAGLRIAQAMDAGYVWINSSSAHVLGTPFGGVKNSGVGREESVEELLSFTQLKTINLALRELPLGGPA